MIGIMLFNELYNEGNYEDAYMVIKNIFNKDSGNRRYFSKFLDLGLKLAYSDIAIEERKKYINEVSNALSIFTDNVEMTRSVIKEINEAKMRIEEANNVIFKDIE